MLLAKYKFGEKEKNLSTKVATVGHVKKKEVECTIRIKNPYKVCILSQKTYPERHDGDDPPELM